MALWGAEREITKKISYQSADRFSVLQLPSLVIWIIYQQLNYNASLHLEKAFHQYKLLLWFNCIFDILHIVTQVLCVLEEATFTLINLFNVTLM